MVVVSLFNQACIEAATQPKIGDNTNIDPIIAEDTILKNNSLISAIILKNADGGNAIIKYR